MNEIIQDKGITGYIFYDTNGYNLYIYKDSKFQKAESEDINDLIKVIQKKIKINTDKLNNIIGFYTAFKSNNMVFKTKNIEGKSNRNSGTKCDQSGKTTVMNTLNKIFSDETRYTSENVGEKNNVHQLCSEMEMYLRYFDRIKKDGKRWFLTPLQASINNIEKFNRKALIEKFNRKV